MTIPVRIDLSGHLDSFASGGEVRDLARYTEIQIGQLVDDLGLEGAVSVEVRARNNVRPLRLEVGGTNVPFPPDVLARPALDSLGLPGFFGGDDGVTIADACLATYSEHGDPSPEDVAHLVVDMIADRPSTLVGNEQASSYMEETGSAASEPSVLVGVLTALLDLGVVPRPKRPVLDAVTAARGRLLDAIEEAFAALQARAVEIVVAPRYRALLTGQDEMVPTLVSKTRLDSSAAEMFELLEQRLLVEWGVIAPDIVWTTAADVPDSMIAVKINDKRSRPFPGLEPNERVVFGADEHLGDATVRRVPNPANPWLELAIVNADDDRVPDTVPTAPPAGFAAHVVYRELLSNAHRLIGAEQTLYLLQDLTTRSPELVALVLRHYTVAEITDLLRALVRERIPPRLLPIVLEELARLVVRPIDAASRLEYIRRGLSEYIDHRFGRGDQSRTFFDLAPQLAELVNVHHDGQAEQVRDLVWKALLEHSIPPLRAAVLVPKSPRENMREKFRRILEPELPEVAVLRREDFAGQIPESVAAIALVPA